MAQGTGGSPVHACTCVSCCSKTFKTKIHLTCFTHLNLVIQSETSSLVAIVVKVRPVLQIHQILDIKLLIKNVSGEKGANGDGDKVEENIRRNHT